jgi:ribosome-associated protein YbcJ (S4-like RNA binding protein)
MSVLTLRPNGISEGVQVIPLVEPEDSEHPDVLSDNSDDSYVYVLDLYGLYGDWLTFPHHTTESGTINSVTIYIRGKVVGQNSRTYFQFELFTDDGSTYAGATEQATDTVITTRSVVLTVVGGTELPFTWADIDTFQGRVDLWTNFLDIYAYDVWIDINYTAGASAALTGTVTTATEADIRAGGKTIILTVTGDVWVVAAGGLFDAQRQNIINGIDSAQSEAHGWDAEVKAKIAVTDVVRTSDTVVTITLDAEAGYDITANETITATIPATALVLGGAVVASPTFTITFLAPTRTTTVAMDALLRATGTKTVSLDGLIRFLAATQAIDLDAIIKAIDTSHTIALDAGFKSVDLKAVVLDALIKEADTKTISLSALFQTLGITTTVVLSALFRDTASITVALDTGFKATDTSTISLDTMFKILGITQTMAIDVIFGVGGVVQIPIDTLLKAVDSKTISIDVLIAGLGITKTVAIDTIFKAIDKATISLDALIKELGITQTVVLDALFRGTSTQVISLGAFFKVIGASTLGIDARFFGIGTQSTALDSIFLSRGYSGISLDAIFGTPELSRLFVDIGSKCSMPIDVGSKSRMFLGLEGGGEQ